jgi:hypothetical protein
VAALCTDRGATSPRLIVLGILIRFASIIGGYVPTVYSSSYLNGCGVLTLSQASVSPRRAAAGDLSPRLAGEERTEMSIVRRILCSSDM